MSRPRDHRETDSVLHRLSVSPGGGWTDRLQHHGARMLLVVVVASLVTVFFPPKSGTEEQRLREGMVAPEDVIAEIAFGVPKSPEELERDREAARQTVPPTLDFHAEASDSMASRLHRFFDSLDSAAARGDQARVQAILEGSQIIATDAQVRYLMDAGRRMGLRRAAMRSAREIIPRGVVDFNEFAAVRTPNVNVRELDVAERSVPVAAILSSRDFFTEAVLLLPPETPPEVTDLYRPILIFHMRHSYTLNIDATVGDREAAAESVPKTKSEVLRGEAIVRAADPIGSAALERLNAYTAALRAAGQLEDQRATFGPLLGSGVLQVMLLSVFGLLLYFNRPEVYANFRWLLLLAVLVTAYFGAAIGIDRAGLATEWLPIAFVALPVAVLWDTRMSLLLVLIIAAMTGALPPFQSYGIVLVLMASGAAAAMSVRAVRRRSETWVSISIIAGAAGLMLLAHGLATSREMADVAAGAAVAAGNATVSALLAMGFLFVFEIFTGITTDQTLLEWADPTRPLLLRLSLEAPGTYAHTINVANLSESAATQIGANGLLCRVGVYYHDVGKMLKPHYFVENQPDGRNPHDRLKPETSAAIVREHVTEGVRLAREANVPDVIIDFLLEHHGTQRIGFFYEKALEEAGEDLDPDRFSYPGPKPQSRETAIVMLADSCESATRAMRDPTPERVRDLITNIVDGKIADGQLDEAPINLREIAIVKEQFVKVLAGVVHRRIEYPATKHLTAAEGAAASDVEPEDGDGGPVPSGVAG